MSKSSKASIELKDKRFTWSQDFKIRPS
jgi:hypothetical protein